MTTTASPPAEGYTAIAQKNATSVKDGPRGTDVLPVAQELTYTWDYSTKRVDLRALYEKSKDLMWNARTDLAWDTPVDPEAENTPDSFQPIYHTPIWGRLDPKREIPV